MKFYTVGLSEQTASIASLVCRISKGTVIRDRCSLSQHKKLWNFANELGVCAIVEVAVKEKKGSIRLN
jgi:hypothetical protein